MTALLLSYRQGRLADRVLGERTRRTQQAGLVLAAVAVGLIAGAG